jgi:hypothetical protein
MRWQSWGAALALAAAGTAVADDLALDASGSASTVVSVAGRSTAQRCLALKAGQRVVWAFVSQGPVDFSIHTRATRQVIGNSSRNATREARDALVVPRDQDYCWGWVNRQDTPVQVSLQLRSK